MDNTKNDIRGYFRHNKAWYKTTYIDVSFGLFNIDDENIISSIGEMNMVWKMVGGNLTPLLKSFNDSWKVLASFGDLIQKLGENDSKLIQEDDFCKILDECGFKDLTPYTYESN